MKFYEIAEQYHNVSELLLNPEFAENTDVLEALDQVQDDLQIKAQNTLIIRQQLKNDVTALDNEIKRLTELKKSRKANIDRIEEYLKFNMDKHGIFKIQCPLFKISYSIRENSKVELDESELLLDSQSERYVEWEPKINKTLIKEDLKNGIPVRGAKLVDSQVLTIK